MSGVNKTYQKNILREFKSARSRLVSLFGIIAIGVLMLTGLMSIAPDMRNAGQNYYSQQNLFDIRVISTLGLNEADITAIDAVEGVEAVMPQRSADLEGSYEGGSTVAVRIQELPADPSADTVANMNRPLVLEGRLPEAENECAIHILSGEAAVGGTLALEDTEGLLGSAELTVVGLVQDPLHFSNDAESSTAGNGTLALIAYVPAGSLDMDYYSACYVKVEGAAQYDNYSDEYQAAVDVVAERLEGIAGPQARSRRDELIEDAQAALDDARAELESSEAEAEAQFAEAEAQLADAEAQLDDALKQLESGEEELAQQKAALPDTMESGADELLAAQEQVLDFEDQLEQIKLLVNLKQVADPLLTYAEGVLENAQQALDEAEPEDEDYIELRDLLARAQALYDSTYAQLAGYQAQLDEGKAEMYRQGLISSPELSNEELVTEAEAALREMKLAVMSGQLSINTGTATAWAAFEQAEAELEAGWDEYNDGVTALETAREEYAAQKADAEAQLADARHQLADAEEEVNDISSGEWYVLDRDSITSLVTYEQNADRIESIAMIFPVFFFLVAALVASTTMTRMVEENRLQMGTLKALAYSDRSIAVKYLFYGLSASALGCIVGMIIGFWAVPSIIWLAYATVFSLPTFRIIVHPALTVAAIIVSMAVVGLTTWFACRTCLREKAAALMLPRAPAAGKRIWMERITPLWSRMSFSQKTTARNMLRYKKRFFMTVLGVAGCTALLLIGFGLQDSIGGIVDKQYNELTHADLTITISDEKALTMEDGLGKALSASANVERWGGFYSHTATVRNADGSEGSVTIIAAQEPAALDSFFTLRTRNGGESISLGSSGAVLTEKTAESLDLAVGDSFWVQISDGTRCELTLTGITENYLTARLFLSEELLEQVLGEEVEWNTVYAVTSCETSAQRNALSEELLGYNYVGGVSFSAESIETFQNTITCINFVVLLIIGCAAALAAVVLYNLINVNLAERKKELATIKVLGFYDNEVYRYIFREIELLSLIGSVVGLFVGALIHQFIIRTVEADQMMFIRVISPSSYLYSVALTMVFTIAVCTIMRRQVKAISMVESMKAPE